MVQLTIFAVPGLAVFIMASAVRAHPGHRDDDQQEVQQTAAMAPPAVVNIDIRDGYRYIQSNGMPNHAAGQFPNAHNPNRISAQHYEFRVPVEPKANEE